MSLYNMMFGQNPAAQILVAILGIGTEEFPMGRFRDCYTNETGSEILLYTRNGGGNREEYQFVFDALSKHPNFLSESDDDFDCTYATIRFSVPEKFREIVKSISDKTDTRQPTDKWKLLLDELASGKETAQTSRALEIGKKIMTAIESAPPGKTEIKTTEGSLTLEKPK